MKIKYKFIKRWKMRRKKNIPLHQGILIEQIQQYFGDELKECQK